MHILKEKNKQRTITVFNEEPKRLFKKEERKAGIIETVSGTCAESGCIDCFEKRCIKLGKQDKVLQNFPSDTSEEVCPVSAIFWNLDSSKIEIDSEKCIKCGLCAARCPVGAIYLNNRGEMEIAQRSQSFTSKKENTEENRVLQKRQIDTLLAGNRESKPLGCFANESFLPTVIKKIEGTSHAQQNIFIRNILISLGNNCEIKRVGEPYTRMDAVYRNPENGSFGSVEIEFGKDALKVSRRTLDDVATIFSRFGISKEEQTPLAVFLLMPNARQEFWQVVKDIKKVTNIEVQTLTVAFLLLLLWNNIPLEIGNRSFYLDTEKMDLAPFLEEIMGRSLNPEMLNLGFFGPVK